MGFLFVALIAAAILAVSVVGGVVLGKWMVRPTDWIADAWSTARRGK